LDEGESEFDGIWLPALMYSIDEMFIDAVTYLASADLSSTTLTVAISETSYYIKNVQSPIAKKAEVIFRTLLFSSLCLEICTMSFLLAKLIVVPAFRKIRQRYSDKTATSQNTAKNVTDH
jgi:hypothetical protein